jgi:enoyl-CoA hydratase/carnithine racemase
LTGVTHRRDTVGTHRSVHSTSVKGLVSERLEGDVLVLTLSRPDKLNALSSALEQELGRMLDGESVAGARAVVLAGEGRAFSAGADVTEFRDRDPASIMA